MSKYILTDKQVSKAIRYSKKFTYFPYGLCGR